MKWFEDLKNTLKSKRERNIIVVLGLVAGGLLLADKTVLHGQLMSIVSTLEIIVFAVFLTVVMIIAGVAVIKALFHVAAGLSLLIFLAQAYCDVPHIASSDAALQGLIVLGLGYIGYDFLRILYKALDDYLKTIQTMEGTWEKWATVIIMLLFVCMFVWMIYQVVNPIVLDLCVYK